MRNSFKLLYLSFITIISCADDTTSYTVGEDFIEIESRVIISDTLSVKASTIQLDSIETSNSNVLLIGAFEDSEFGKINSTSYLNLKPSDYAINNDAVYDSIGVILYYNRYYHGDTTQVQTYKVHEIIEDFEPSDDSGSSFYNTSSLNYSKIVLGEINFTPYPNKKDSIYIPLNSEFGKSIFTKIKEDDIENSVDLDKLFKGITIQSQETGNTVLGFNKQSIVMRMYYTVNSEYNENNEYFKEFKIGGYNNFFNNIIHDKLGTPLQSITNSEENISTLNTNNTAFIQAGTGLNMRIEIPHIKTYNELEKNGTIISASLKFHPTIKSYESNSIGADSLKIFVVDQKNRFIKQLTGLNGSPSYAKLQKDNDEFNSKYFYSVDISSFVEEIQQTPVDLNYSLLFQFPNSNNSLNKIKIYDSTQKNEKMKVDLTYLLY